MCQAVLALELLKTTTVGNIKICFTSKCNFLLKAEGSNNFTGRLKVLEYSSNLTEIMQSHNT